MHADRFLAPLQFATFAWDVVTDIMSFGPGAEAMFRDLPADALATGQAFAKLIEPSRTVRTDALSSAAVIGHGSDGTPYQIEYGLRVRATDQIIWVEEFGRCFAGADGKPVRAEGVVHIINERHARDEQLLKLSHQDPLTGELNRTRLTAAL